jgi:hypothetical protein
MTNNKQQTAVWWLFSETLEITLQLANKRISHRNWELQMVKLYEQAKEMEKQQAIKLHYEYELYVMITESDVMTFGQFYKQTYGGGDK